MKSSATTGLTYSEAGVNIDAANDAKKAMSASINDTGNSRVLNRVGAFASLYDIRFDEYNHPVLVLKTEEPGSKQLLAFRYDRIESICADMINHLINDCIVMGARPLSVQDAIICGKLEKDRVVRIVDGIAAACKAQGCNLTGGETSEQPGVLEPGVYILTSSIVGIVEKDDIIDGSRIAEGDVVLSLESSGLHTNGYTLVRTLMQNNPALVDTQLSDGRGFIDTILEPHRCYYQCVRELFSTGKLTGMAHITGGGVRENLDRILPKTVNAEIDLAKYTIQPIFKLIRDTGSIGDAEMLRTFNMGVGMAVVCRSSDAESVREHIESRGVQCRVAGRIVAGTGDVEFVNTLNWE